MSNVVRFKELLVEPVRNGVYKQKEFHGRGCKIINMGELFSFPRLHDVPMKRVELTEKEQSRSLVQQGDLLFARRSLVAEGAGRCSIVSEVNEPTTFESSIIRARPNPTLASSDYLYYFFSSPIGRELMGTILRQMAVSGITGSDLMELEIECPELGQQKAIAALLSSLDDRITLLRETNATLEAIAQALFKSWFVDFDPVRAKAEGLQPEGMDATTAALFPDSFEESLPGSVPKGWVHCRVEDFAEKVGMGPFGSNIKVETFVSQGVPVISGQHLRQVLVEDSEFNFITLSHAEKLSNSCVYEGDVVFTHAGSIGQVALLHRHARFDRYVLSQRQFFLRCDRGKMRPEWITYYFHSAQGQHQLLANTSQVGVPSIARPVSYLRSIEVLVPSKDLVERFSDVADGIHQKVLANRDRIQTLTQLRDTLLPRLISGQLRLPEAEALLAEAQA